MKSKSPKMPTKQFFCSMWTRSLLEYYNYFAPGCADAGTTPTSDKKKAEKKPWTADDVQFWLTTALSLFMEFAGIGSLLYSQYLAVEGTSEVFTATKNQNKDNSIGFKPKTITAHSTSNEDYSFERPKTKIGFQMERASTTPSLKFKSNRIVENLSTPEFKEPIKDLSHLKGYEEAKTLVAPDFYNNIGIDKEDLRKYVEYMYSSPKYLKSGKSPGYNPIGLDTGIGVENARKIKAHLERLGIVKTVGTDTFVLVDLQACRTKVQA